MESPFSNDPFAMVYQAFKNLYPDKDCVCVWQPEEIKDDAGHDFCGMTTFADGEVIVDISVRLPVADAIETLAHELAHVAAGEQEAHGEKWEAAFDAIHAEFDRIGNEMFGEDSGVAVQVADGKGGWQPDDEQ